MEGRYEHVEKCNLKLDFWLPNPPLASSLSPKEGNMRCSVFTTNCWFVVRRCFSFPKVVFLDCGRVGTTSLRSVRNSLARCQL